MALNHSLPLISGHEGRLDKVLAMAAAESAPEYGLSRARLQQLIKSGYVFLNGQPKLDPNAKALVGEIYQIDLPAPTQAEPKAQSIPLSILFEDDDLLVINKPAGLVVHPAAGNHDNTLVNALLFHCGNTLSGIGGVARPGIVHRLDKDTSGLMVAAKNDYAHQKLTSQFSDRSLSRVYQAIVFGVPDPIAGDIEGSIGRHPKARQKMAVVSSRSGKEALTHYKVLEVFGAGLASLVECKLATGRTHQIRVHMAHKGYPVVGDPLYAGRRGRTRLEALDGFKRQALHAGEISFIHPRTGKKMRFKANLPQDMENLLKALKKTKEKAI